MYIIVPFFSSFTMSFASPFPSPSCFLNSPQSSNWSNRLHNLLRLENFIATDPGFSSTSTPYLVLPRISLRKRLKTSCGMGRSKQTIQGCTLLIFELKRRKIAVFARIMLRCSMGYSSPMLYLGLSRRPPNFPFTTASASLFSSWNVLSKSFSLYAFEICHSHFDFPQFSASFIKIIS